MCATPDNCTRIAMWSGPRNISTAMMYSFAARPDCMVWDEPFYAFYLSKVDFTHPMNAEVIAAGEPDWNKVVSRCAGPLDHGKTVFYQKHMTHHMLAGFDRSFALKLKNAFLIRDPARVLASYARKRDEVTLQDIGFVEQAELFDMVSDHLGEPAPVVDTDDILADPEGTLTRLCQALGIDFDPHMLKWQEGPKPYDGIWARHWYNAVWQSTGFGQPSPAPETLPDSHRSIEAAARIHYDRLMQWKL